MELSAWWFRHSVQVRLSLFITDQDIDRLIQEDVPYGDLTTRALGIGGKSGRMVFQARHPLVLCGAAIAGRIIQKLGAKVLSCVTDGTALAADDVVLVADGEAACLHAAWKVSQTVIEWCSGIATSVSAIRLAAESASGRVRIACARKAPPGTRNLAIMAVQAGGAEMHRTGLSETILIFPEHLNFVGPNPIALAIADAKRCAPERTVVIEVNSERDALLAAHAGADVVQLEKFTPEAVHRVAEQIGDKCLIAAAGGVRVENAALYAGAGANILVTSAPYSAPPAEIQVVITHIQ